jgi:hypothetical protein
MNEGMATAISSRWRANVAFESNKLSNKSEWTLAGSTGILERRTRHGGFGRPQLVKKEFSEDTSEDEDEKESEDVEGGGGDDDDEEEEELEELVNEMEINDDEEEEQQKPSHTRVITEVKALLEAFQLCRCPKCGEALEPELKTVCIATSFRLSCTNKKCTYVLHSDAPAPTSIDTEPDDMRERMTDYAVNVLYVVGLTSCGDGGTEAGRMLGLLGLPNNTTMEKRSFSMIEERISSSISFLTNNILLENLIEEVRVTVEKTPDLESLHFDLWKQALDGTIVLPKSNYPKIRVSFDMAWQQRSSGNRYASPSGHALFVGGFTRKPISMVIKSKLCNYCLSFKRRVANVGLEVPLHDCLMNHEGSSGAMEPAACLDMVVDLYRTRFVTVGLICADNDASTRSLLKWSNADYMKNNNTIEPPKCEITKGPNKGKLHPRPDRGRLPGDVPEPMFVADPNHRKKVLTGELIAMLTAKKADKATLTRNDTTRIGKNFGYMIRALPRFTTDEQITTAGKAVLEHHFDNHEFCGRWCPRKRLTEAQRAAQDRYYRDKNRKEDGELYRILCDKIGRFITLDRLKEVAHGMDTQCNESFNNTASWFAPKNKVYCGSKSLRNRLFMAVGINTLGLHEYFTRLFKTMGITMTTDVEFYLESKDRTRSKRLAKIKTKDMKKKRVRKKFEQLKEDEAIARKERSKRDGTYQRGLNMQDSEVVGYTDSDLQQQAAAAKRRRQQRTTVVCPHCGKKGHATKRSKQCTQYVPTSTARTAALPEPGNLSDTDAAEDIEHFEDLLRLHDVDTMDDEDGTSGVL